MEAKLKELRKAQEISSYELAKILGKTPQQIFAIEKANKCSLQMLTKILLALGYTQKKRLKSF